MNVARVWGVREHETTAHYPCDDLLPAADSWYRAVTVHACPATVFRWLCQLKVAPYSYDSLDNFGRRSPRELTPGVDDLVVGDRVMTIFRLASFARDTDFTVEMHHPAALRVLGELALSYAIRECAAGRVRLIAKLRVTDPPGPMGGLRRRLLAWGDLLMMRRQLLTLKELAERTGTR